MRRHNSIVKGVILFIASIFISTINASAFHDIPHTVPWYDDGGTYLTFTDYFQFYDYQGKEWIIYCQNNNTGSFSATNNVVTGYTAPYYISFYNPDCGSYPQEPMSYSGSYWARDTGMRYLDHTQALTDTFRSTINLTVSSTFTPPPDASFYGGMTSYTQGVIYVPSGTNIPLPETPLSFPLDKDCSGVPCTPYTAPVSSVMDHSMTIPYTKDGIVLAFNGEEGDVDEGCYCYTTSSYCDSNNYTSCTVAGFMKDGGGDFLSGIINYDDSYLYYDGHPGYDYLATSGTDILAPEEGTLCVATNVTQQPQPADIWRDTSHCPLSTVGGTSWSGYHTFYIIHEDLYVNGSTDDYMTVFLHSDDLESSVRDDIESYGYVEVSKNQHIAESGDFGSSGAYHMHLEVYKKVGENWERVDPYGDGTNNILWEQE